MAADSDRLPDTSSWLTTGPVARAQAVMTRLRFALALPVVALLAAFADRGPVWPGIAVALAGELVQIWASAHLRKNVALIATGPYRWVRNPMYLGRFLVGLGFALLTWRWWLILPYIVLFWLYAQARVLGEEKRLTDLFGDDYRAYCAAVRRWLPHPPPALLPNAPWSWACVFGNHELRVAAVVCLALALLAWRASALGPLWR